MDPVAVTVVNCKSLGIFAGGALELDQWIPEAKRVATFGLIYEMKVFPPMPIKSATESASLIPKPIKLPPAKWQGLLLLDNDNPAGSVRIVSRCIDCAYLSLTKKAMIYTLTGWCKIQIGDGDPITRPFEVCITMTGLDCNTFKIKVFEWLNVNYGEYLYEAEGKIKNGGVLLAD